MTRKSNASFISCITKINNILIDNAEDLDILMSMYNLNEYMKIYSNTSGGLWNYYRDEQNSGAVGNINYTIENSKSFNYKTSITGKLEDNNVEKENVETFVPLKYLNTIWRNLDRPLINWEVSLTLTWSENCIITSKPTRDANPNANPGIAEIDNPTGATFIITDTKLYVPVATLFYLRWK